jgi:hypothetical protein
MMWIEDLVLMTFHIIVFGVLKGHSVFIIKVKQSKSTIGTWVRMIGVMGQWEWGWCVLHSTTVSVGL